MPQLPDLMFMKPSYRDKLLSGRLNPSNNARVELEVYVFESMVTLDDQGVNIQWVLRRP
jgi:hypothetical protein